MEQTPFYIASVIDDMDDILWAWNQFMCVCDSHAPLKEIKVRSVSSPWINNTIRLKMNRRFKLFKRAVETKDQNTWADYKRLRNEITSDLRKAKAAYLGLLWDLKSPKVAQSRLKSPKIALSRLKSL